MLRKGGANNGERKKQQKDQPPAAQRQHGEVVQKKKTLSMGTQHIMVTVTIAAPGKKCGNVWGKGSLKPATDPEGCPASPSFPCDVAGADTALNSLL